MGCISCEHARFVAPAEWRAAYDGQEYRRWMVKERIRATGEGQRLLCTLYPEWREYDTNHYCGQWVPDGGLEGVRLMEIGARGAVEEGRRAVLAVTDLRRQLKRSREVSAKRLARLRNGAERS